MSACLYMCVIPSMWVEDSMPQGLVAALITASISSASFLNFFRYRKVIKDYVPTRLEFLSFQSNLCEN